MLLATWSFWSIQTRENFIVDFRDICVKVKVLYSVMSILFVWSSLQTFREGLETAGSKEEVKVIYEKEVGNNVALTCFQHVFNRFCIVKSNQFECMFWTVDYFWLTQSLRFRNWTVNEWGWVSYEELWRSRRVLLRVVFLLFLPCF